MSLILASKSPRRRDILKTFIPDIKCIPGNIEEKFDESFDIYSNMMSLSKKKAESIIGDFPEDIVLGSDTIVFFEDKILHKPKDENEARQYLNMLSNNTHSVITSFSLISKDLSVSDYVETEVEFIKLNDDVIDDYIKSCEWKGKAGGYAIQGKGALLVNKINGDYFSVVGLPISKIAIYLNKYFDINLMED